MTRTIPLLLVVAVACGGTSTETTATPVEPAAATAGADVVPASSAEAAPLEPDAAIAAALAGAHRSEENRARDVYRHPQETLLFFGLRPDMSVVELEPGGGWYTEVLAPVLHDHGQLFVAVPSLEGERAKYTRRLHERLAQDPDVFDRVQQVTLELPDHAELGPEGSADMVVTFRSTHGWVRRGQAADVYAAAFRVLKPGGVFGVVQHRAPEGTDPVEMAPKGYVPEAHVVELAEAAGFVLEERSEVNANPKDTKDHPEGVWTLPPVLRLEDQDRDTYTGIGESDRMTLRFRKPAAVAVP